MPTWRQLLFPTVAPRTIARVARGAFALVLFLPLALPASARAVPAGMRAAQEALRRETGAKMTSDPASGAARSMRFAPGRGPAAPAGATAARASDAFVARHGAAFGLGDATRELAAGETSVDGLGMTHRRYRQQVDGVEVFGATLDVHMGRGNEVRSANGRIVPGIAVDVRPRFDAVRAQRLAVAAVLAEPPGSDEEGAGVAVGPALEAAGAKLWVYDDGMVRSRRGEAHLAWLVEVRGPGLREFVFVDAHSGKVVERWSGIHDGLYRRLYQGSTSTQVWQEGDAFPGSLDQDQRNIVNASGDAYWFFRNAFGRDSWDTLGAEMKVVKDPDRGACPNAFWDGSAANFCGEVVADDVVGHEWAHAYTETLNPLVYLWQPGALNESYSDIWGETIDRLNGAGSDFPDAERTAGACSIFMSSTHPAEIVVSAPASISGTYVAGPAVFGPVLDASGVGGQLAAASDAADVTTDACDPLADPTALSGRVALVDRGGCTFASKVKRAQDAGAIAVVVADNDPATVPGTAMGGSDPTIVIPAVLVAKATGESLRAALAAGVSIVLRRDPSDWSFRWLVGEDASGLGGAFRDMWNPACAGDPGRLGDANYWCSTADGGGVHTNSGVPNHGFALVVDGGIYAGRTVPALGLVKAVAIHGRAQAVYETVLSDFSDHADALEAACDDLVGTALPGLGTGDVPPPSVEVVTAEDCAAIAEMELAVEMRSDPVERCGFDRLLAPDAPATCAGTGVAPTAIADWDFESGAVGWTFADDGIFSGWPGLSWSVSTGLPGGRTGTALFATDPPGGDCQRGAGDWSGVMTATSPPIEIPAGVLAMPRVDFEHWVATQAGRDGGQVAISVNDGPFAPVPGSAFLFNPYNTTLAKGNALPFNDSPLAGLPAFSGTDSGSLSGSWGLTRVDLGLLGVKPGDSVRLRFSMGLDGCGGVVGWWIDDLSVRACESVGAGAIAIEQATLSPGSIAGRGSVSLKATIATGTTASDIVDASTSYRFDLASGGGAFSESLGVLASECKGNRSGNRVTCRSADRRVRAVFSDTRNPGEWRLSLVLKGLAFASTPPSPVSLAVTRSGRSWTGLASACSASPTGKLLCKG